MNIKSLTITGLLVGFALMLPFAASGEDEPGRLPPNVQKYPAKGNVEQTSYGATIIYTTDSSSKVIDFYRKSLKMDPVEGGKFLLGKDVSRLDRPEHLDSDVWLNIYSGADIQRNTLDDKDLFGFLQGEIMVKKIHSEEDLQPVKQKYAHLAKGWYPDFDVKEKLKACSEATRGNVTASREKMPSRNKQEEDEMLAQIQQLMAQGKYQEAGKLAQGSAKPGMETARAMQQENKTDHWDQWLACLDEVDKHDFQTKIQIGLYHNRHFIPSTDVERGQNTNQNESNKSMGKNVGDKVKGLKRMFKF